MSREIFVGILIVIDMQEWRYSDMYELSFLSERSPDKTKKYLFAFVTTGHVYKRESFNFRNKFVAPVHNELYVTKF